MLTSGPNKGWIIVTSNLPQHIQRPSTGLLNFVLIVQRGTNVRNQHEIREIVLGDRKRKSRIKVEQNTMKS